ncbi:hypothetical protein BDW62DRAFT_111088 [Aspergillus aurantiobrunneus]
MHKEQAENQWQGETREAPPMAVSQSYALEQLREDLLPLGQHDISTARDLPETTLTRQRASFSAQSLDQDECLPGKLLHIQDADSALSAQNSVLYLAYGSNLASKTFLGMRGIKPLSQLNVVVPELRLTFDLPGLPYIEPCFAGTHFRSNPTTYDKASDAPNPSEKHSLLQGRDSDQDRYQGPVVGVVYEVTLTDYAKIIATEGGGRGYKDITVTCYPFPKDYDPSDPIPERPETQPIKAHTLLSPAGITSLKQLQPKSNPGSLPNARRAQPSARYLKLITTGAAEHNLPFAYREYLAQIQPYRITSVRQRIGMVALLITWAPPLLLVMKLSRVFAHPDGRSPEWIGRFADIVTNGMWSSYDNFFVHIFGDGEMSAER